LSDNETGDLAQDVVISLNWPF